jgi:hypothetical protein
VQSLKDIRKKLEDNAHRMSTGGFCESKMQAHRSAFPPSIQSDLYGLKLVEAEKFEPSCRILHTVTVCRCGRKICTITRLSLCLSWEINMDVRDNRDRKEQTAES